MSDAYLAHRAAIRAINAAHYGQKKTGQPFLPVSVSVGPFTAPAAVHIPPNVAGPYVGIVRGVSDISVVCESHSHSGESAA